MVFKYVFDELVCVMLWCGLDDKLCYWVFLMQCNGLVKVLEVVGMVVMSDMQFIKVVDGLGDLGVLVYVFRLLVMCLILIVSKGDWLIVLFELGILLDKDGKLIFKQVSVLVVLLLDDIGRCNVQGMVYVLFVQELMGYYVVVSVNYLLFGYQ